MKKIKESKCSISSYSVEKDEDRRQREVKEKFVLPDGSTIELSTERTLAGEILFAPERAGLEYPCTQQVTQRSRS